MLTLKDLVENGYDIEKIEQNTVSYSIPELENLTFEDLESMNYDADYDSINIHDTDVTGSLLVSPQDRFNICELTPSELMKLCEKYDDIEEFDAELTEKFGSY